MISEKSQGNNYIQSIVECLTKNKKFKLPWTIWEVQEAVN